MVIANLTRYELEQYGDGGWSGGWGEMSECDSGEWVKFEEAMEASSNSLQQLKAEIAEVRKYIENMRFSKMSAESILNHVDGTLRQLSAV